MMLMKNQRDDRQWTAPWIGSGLPHVDWKTPARSAPWFRHDFSLLAPASEAKVYLCGLGYYELYLNGEKIGDHVLDPIVTQYDIRCGYLVYDVTRLLKNGSNTFGVVLGTGWYDCHTSEAWHFDKASWRDNPKFIFELVLDGSVVLSSDESWHFTLDGPIRFDGLRNGETYDARMEINHWAEPEFDDSAWEKAVVVPGPGGALTLQTAPPCKVMQTLKPVRVIKSAQGSMIYDLGQNIAGWARIRGKGEPGTEIQMRYSELLGPYADAIDQSNIKPFIFSGEVQTDRYIFKGESVEEWEPRFTYHGFQYVEVSMSNGAAEIFELEGRVVHSSFQKIGRFACSMSALNTLFQCTQWSFQSNFVGIPTDCPHREKNGWTGDASLAAETGLFNFDLKKSYFWWTQTIADSQRINGQLPGIVPTSGWGFNWGSGPAWDSAFILIPWEVYRYTGDRSLIDANYANMKLYLAYLGTLATRGIVSFGLGDWCHYDRTRAVDVSVTSTAYYYAFAVTLAKCAELLARWDDACAFRRLAEAIKGVFNDTFYNQNGTYAKGEATALGCAIYQGLCPDEEISKVAATLAGLMEERSCRADFGILGAKYIPRALADNGYGETAFKIISQGSYPGWIDWINHGANTLWETWGGESSRNHIMFGDVSAWMMQYLGGIRPALPGFEKIHVSPIFPNALDAVSVSHISAHGEIKSTWQREKGGIACRFEFPEGTTADVELPGISRKGVSGIQVFKI